MTWLTDSKSKNAGFRFRILAAQKGGDATKHAFSDLSQRYAPGHIAVILSSCDQYEMMNSVRLFKLNSLKVRATNIQYSISFEFQFTVR